MKRKLRQLRQERGISQAFISKRLGYKYPSGYANIEMGRNRLGYEQAIVIAEILNVSVDELQDNDNFFVQKLHATSKTSA